MSTPYLDLGRIYGDSAFEAWCKRQDPVLDSTLTASWLAFLAAIKGETGDNGEPGADGLTEGEVDARIDAAVGVSVQAQLAFDAAPTDASENPVKSGGVFTALSGKQATLEWDSTPTAASTKPVTSGGVFSAIAAASIGDTGWVSMTLNGAVVSAGAIRYRVKNGVCYLCGFVTIASSNLIALTTSRIPEEYMPSDTYGTFVQIDASNGVWYRAYMTMPFGGADAGKIVMQGVANYNVNSAVANGTAVTIKINPASLWVVG